MYLAPLLSCPAAIKYISGSQACIYFNTTTNALLLSNVRDELCASRAEDAFYTGTSRACFFLYGLHLAIVYPEVVVSCSVKTWSDSQKQGEVIGGHKSWLVIDDVRKMIEQEE
jgi:hypothetical protein